MKRSGEDRRIIKTRRALHEAMIRLLKTTKLENMTVTMLCNEANVSRSAFYDHYSVPEDCFNEIAQETNEQIVDRFQNTDMLSFEEFTDIYFHYVKEHQEIFRTMFAMNDNNPALQQSLGFFQDYLYRMVPNYPQYPDLYTKFLLYGYKGVVSDWLENGCKDDYHDISDIMRKIFYLLENSDRVDQF